MERTLLLVDDEQNILSALTRLFRREDYCILRANSGVEALEMLKTNAVGVIISDQRMPEMTGVELLSKVKELYPDVVRIMLSGYTDLKSVTDAINEGAIYKFLTKPWDDDLLKENVRVAFRHYELVSENERLNRELQKANEELSRINLQLAADVDQTTRVANINHHALELAQHILECLPLGIVGLGDDDLIALANREAHKLLLPNGGALVGLKAGEVFTEALNDFYRQKKFEENRLNYNGSIEMSDHGVSVNAYRIPIHNSNSGSVVVMMLKEGNGGMS
jgi:FixJ family two-component response regulator